MKNGVPARNRRRHLVMGFGTVCLAGVAAAASSPRDAAAGKIPAFARQYRTGCSTCHTAAPKLNVLGEAFRLNGYRLPDNDALLRREEQIPLGEDPWKDLWPRAVWPGAIPATVPLALRIQSDVRATREEGAPSTTYRFPHEVYLLAGTSLGEDIAAFLEVEWSREQALQVVQAKIKFQDVVPFLPDRAANLWVGFQNPYLFTFADRQLDRAGRQHFLWQEFRAAELGLRNPGTGEVLRSANEFSLRRSQASLELNGLATGRLFYAVGLAQGAGGATVDNNDHKDVYYKLRYKLGGLRLDGAYDAEAGPPRARYGQLFDKSIILEHFGYFGAEPVGADAQDVHRAFGMNARVLYDALDIGLGYVWGHHRDPWGLAVSAPLRFRSTFAKAEYLVFPWLIGSLKVDVLDIEIPDALRGLGFTQGPGDRSRVLPGVIALVRQNVRLVFEGEIFTKHAPAAELGRRRPHSLWGRIDVAF